jgi:uncharacterized surface protein with fasciclin (FAS1) repeats
MTYRFFLLLFLTLVTACSDSDDTSPISLEPTQSIIEIAVGTQRFSILAEAVVAADLADTEALGGDGPFTVFAPNNNAFSILLAELGLTKVELFANTELLTQVLTAHVVDGAVNAEAAIGIAQSDVKFVPTLNASSPLVLTTSTIMDETLLNANTSVVITPDVLATNGIIHEIDQVIAPFQPTFPDDPSDTIVDVVITAASDSPGEFTILLDAVLATSGLGDGKDIAAILSSPGDFTVFAPTDAAFAKLLTEQNLTATDLLSNAGEVSDLLLQHTLLFRADSLTAYTQNGNELESARSNTKLSVAIEQNALSIEGANVIDTDIFTSNGVIHVIDSVIYDVK